MEYLDLFIKKTITSVKYAQEKKRAIALLTRWSTLWPNSKRNITYTSSNHGAFLHFNQLIDTTWSNVLTFRTSKKYGLSMKGPDVDRIRKSHKYRNNPIDRTDLDAIFISWSAHPEAHPAGNAVEFYLDETPDEVWEACLQELLQRL